MKERLIEFLAYLGIGQTKFEEKVGLSRGFVNNIGENITSKSLKKITEIYPELNINWLKTGVGSMLNSDTQEEESEVKFYDTENVPAGKRLIPLYNDVGTIGGVNNKVANLDTHSTSPSEWIDPGDWFRGATAAIRHYGDSMKEYPSGCILVLKEVLDRRLIIPGKDYVIETSEYRITKKIRLCDNPEYIRAYSTNEEKYEDGELIHQPFDIHTELINRFLEVLGYVVKTGSGTMVHTNQNK